MSEPTAAAAAAAANETTSSVQSNNGMKTKQNLPNPGSVEALHQEAKGTFAQNHLIDGVKFSLNKPVSAQLQVGHTFTLGSRASPPGYHFNATSIGASSNPKVEASPVLLADIDTEGVLTANCIHQWAPGFKTKLQAQMNHANHSMKGEVDYAGKDYTVNVKSVNPDVVNGSGIFLLSYLQSITPKIALGTEAMYQFGNGMQHSGLSLVGRYTSKSGIFCGNVSPTGVFQLTYHHRVNEKVSLASEIECNMQTKESLTTVGYQFDFRQSTFRGQADSSGVVAAALEQKMAPGVSFMLTGTMDHMKNASSFGFGFIIGGQ